MNTIATSFRDLAFRRLLPAFVTFLDRVDIWYDFWTGRGSQGLHGTAQHRNTQTNVNALKVIRTHDNRVRASQDLAPLRPSSQCDQQVYVGTNEKL